MKTNKEKLDSNMELFMKDIQAVLKKHKIKGVKPVALQLEKTENRCPEGYKRVCKTYTDPVTGALKVRCKCVKN